ncbi:hypothetical protein [Mycolicibacterium phlei]|nr:hypothetical protein [Mycolicibacterium phlei]
MSGVLAGLHRRDISTVGFSPASLPISAVAWAVIAAVFLRGTRQP